MQGACPKVSLLIQQMPLALASSLPSLSPPSPLARLGPAPSPLPPPSPPLLLAASELDVSLLSVSAVEPLREDEASTSWFCCSAAWTARIALAALLVVQTRTPGPRWSCWSSPPAACVCCPVCKNRRVGSASRRISRR